MADIREKLTNLNSSITTIDTFMMTIIKYSALSWVICIAIVHIVLYGYCRFINSVDLTSEVNTKTAPVAAIPLDSSGVLNTVVSMYKDWINPDVKCLGNSEVCCNISKISLYASPIIMLLLFYLTGHYVKGKHEYLTS
jgi:hypothetical protein